MRLIEGARRTGRKLISRFAGEFFPVRWKEFNELKYWKGRKRDEGHLSNEHYQYFYTTHFGLDASYYQDKVILDIGCGPRGSLEWASMASRRIGLDPLAKEYLRLGADRHRMEYIDAPSEHIPLRDAECDAVFSFNSLDHVEDIDQTLNEIKRIVRPGGIFLLLVEVNHTPTACEPHKLRPDDLLHALKPEFECKDVHVFAPVARGVYASLRAGQALPDPEETREVGYLSAKFVRT